MSFKKTEWVSQIYRFICRERIENKEEIEKMYVEKALFLTQYYSLKNIEKLNNEKKENKAKPFFPYKMYIEGNRISVRYVSDLMRVAKCYGRVKRKKISRYIVPWQSFDCLMEYKARSNKYFRMTHAEIDKKVSDIISKDYLDPQYFVKAKYNDKVMRMFARIRNYKEGHFYMTILLTFCIAIALGLNLSFIILPFITNHYGLNYLEKFNKLLPFYIGGFILTVILIPWIKKILSPTQFEIDNGYVD